MFASLFGGGFSGSWRSAEAGVLDSDWRGRAPSNGDRWIVFGCGSAGADDPARAGGVLFGDCCGRRVGAIGGPGIIGRFATGSAMRGGACSPLDRRRVMTASIRRGGSGIGSGLVVGIVGGIGCAVVRLGTGTVCASGCLMACFGAIAAASLSTLFISAWVARVIAASSFRRASATSRIFSGGTSGPGNASRMLMDSLLISGSSQRQVGTRIPNPFKKSCEAGRMARFCSGGRPAISGVGTWGGRVFEDSGGSGVVAATLGFEGESASRFVEGDGRAGDGIGA